MTSFDRNEEWREALQAARERARFSKGAVLDELQTCLSTDALAGLSRLTGIDLVDSVDLVEQPRPLELGGPSGLQAFLVRHVDGRELLLMADPWDEAEVQRLSTRASGYVEPAAGAGPVLRVLTNHPGTSPSGADGPTTPSPGGVVQFVDQAIEAAHREGASDLHLECDRGGVTAKLRLDGVMTRWTRLEGKQPAEEVISRIKVLAQLDITERRLPQDGRFRYAGPNVELDLRVSIMPSVFGEDAVLRLLDKTHLRSQDEQVTLDALGFAAAEAKRIRTLSNLPNGLLLVTGPTGSGKTTTVYAALSETNTGLEKIITIEDPVEYELPGVLQIPVNDRKGLTFARGLRSVLRHDPDRILVGEIRDGETADIAVQSALTGHLVFTTVHANSLFDVVGRFRHFGIDMFGFVSSLNGVVVQRLMRQLCVSCVGWRDSVSDERHWLNGHGVQDLNRLPQARGCSDCHQTGYRGRFVVAEIHRIDDAFRDLVMRNAEVSELKRAAFAGDATPLVRLAIEHVRSGRTSLEELFRVVGQI